MSDLSRKVERKELLLNNWRGTFPGKTPIEIRRELDEARAIIEASLPVLSIDPALGLYERALKLLAQ